MYRSTHQPALGASLLAACLLVGCADEAPEPTAGQAPAPTATAAPESPVPVAQLDQPIAPTHYRLELRIDPRQERLSGNVAIELEAEEAVAGFWLHGKELDVSSARVTTAGGDTVGAHYEQRDPSGVARVSLDGAAGPGALTLHLEWSAAFNTQTNSIFRAERGGDHYVASQFQPIGARQSFPGFDEPGFKVPFDIALITPSGDVAITNTPEREAVDLGDGFTRHVYETTEPLPTYLLAFAVGPYDLVDYGEIPPNAVRAHGVPLRAIAAKGQGGKLGFALENTAGILAALEEYFALPYPYRKLDLIAMPTSFGGAMENAGAVTYDEYLLLLDDNASLDQRRAYTAVHAHELGHMWFGDLVTPTWWNDIWLNESFATWISYKAAQAVWPEGEFNRSTLKGALGAMSEDSLAAARQIREPVDHNNEIVDAFDGITYQKGGGVLAMLERYVGEDNFRDGIRLHIERHANGVADAEEFIDSVAEGSGHDDIRAAFASFIEQPGVPLIDVKVNCEPGQAPSIEVRQSRYAPLGSSIDTGASQWLVPMCVSYLDGGERKDQCEMLRERQQTLPLEASACPSMLHPNADGAGYYRFSLEETWWQGLVAGLADMEAVEALSAADSLDAAFRAGGVSADTYVAGIRALVNHETWDVVEAAIDHLEGLTDVFPPEQLPAVEAAMGALTSPRYAALNDATDNSAELLKSRLQRFLVVIARDPGLRAPMAAAAAKRVGMDGEPDPAAIPPSELETVLTVGVQDLGAPFFEHLLEMALASEDRVFRSDALGALARTEDPALSARLHEVILSGQIQGYEPLSVINRQMARGATTDLTFTWLRENLDAYLEFVPQTFAAQFIAGLGSYLCSAERAREWSRFIEANAGRLPGYERSLAQAVERSNLCGGLREARAQDLFQALNEN